MKAFVTGGAGFVGSNLIDELLLRDNSVVCYDNFSTGNQNFLKYAFDQPSKKFISVIGDILNEYLLTKAMSGCDIVFHFAANADVRHGVDQATITLLAGLQPLLRLLVRGDVAEGPDPAIITAVRSDHRRRVAVKNPAVRQNKCIAAGFLFVLIHVLDPLEKQFGIRHLFLYELQNRLVCPLFDEFRWQSP